MRYPEAEWVPWQGTGVYRGVNRPIANVLHIMEGWAATARQWAQDGHVGASWTTTIARSGKVMQHLDDWDGGWQAGVTYYRYNSAREIIGTNPPPTWALWKGWNYNVNHYTLGTEHEGFSGQPFTDDQLEASFKYNNWLCDVHGWPLDQAHFPSHAEIALIDRPNDFHPPAMRTAYYAALLKAGDEDEMTPEQLQMLDKAYELAQASWKVLTGGLDGPAQEWIKKGNSMIIGYSMEQEEQDRFVATVTEMAVIVDRVANGEIPDADSSREVLLKLQHSAAKFEELAAVLRGTQPQQISLGDAVYERK